MDPPNHSDPSEKTWQDYRLWGVTYTSRRRPRFHGYLDSYHVTDPAQSDADLIEAYYDSSIPGLSDKSLEYYATQTHQNSVLEAQFIRQGWIDEISQSDSTPDFDLSYRGRTPLERARGILCGLAVGDALGRPVEFWSPEEIEAEYGVLDSMVGHGTHGQPSGTVTDDTEQAMCIATSLATHGKWDPERVAEQFVDWYNSSPFDIGNTTAKSMEKLAAGVPWDEAGVATQEEFSQDRATNGSVMRCAPLAIAYPYDTESLIQYSRESSMITHAHPRCTWGAAILNVTIANIITGTEQPLQHALDSVRGDAPPPLVSALSDIRTVDEGELSSSGDVTDTLQTALYHGLTSSSFVDAVTSAVNRGGDADTIGAVTGAIAGARFASQPTLDEDGKAVPLNLLGETTTTGLRILPDHILEIENELGTFPEDTTWRSTVSTITIS